MEEKEIAECDAFLKRKKLPLPSDCVENGFSWYNEAGGEAGRLGGDVSTYSFLVNP